jgi:hypothetical protein
VGWTVPASLRGALVRADAARIQRSHPASGAIDAGATLKAREKGKGDSGGVAETAGLGAFLETAEQHGKHDEDQDQQYHPHQAAARPGSRPPPPTWAPGPLTVIFAPSGSGPHAVSMPRHGAICRLSRIICAVRGSSGSGMQPGQRHGTARWKSSLKRHVKCRVRAGRVRCG